MAVWDDLLTERDRRVLEKSGYGAAKGLGQRPALLIIDAQNKFVGHKGPILDSMDTYPLSLGEEAWAAVDKIAILLGQARDKGVPVFYTASISTEADIVFHSIARKRRTGSVAEGVDQTVADAIAADLAPRPTEPVLIKKHASGFFGTPLISFLNALRVDTLLITGFVTSGCVRATVVDGAAYNFNVAVVQDGVADRLHLTHKANLLDIHMKYGDVITAAEALDYLQTLQED
jgi:nicotinamidase-related amidase